MELHVVIEGDKDLTGQLYRQLKEAIRSGRLTRASNCLRRGFSPSSSTCRARSSPRPTRG